MSVMSNEINLNLDEDGFQKVNYKKKLGKSKPHQQLRNTNTSLPNPNFDQDSCVRRISAAKSEIATTDLFDSVKALLEEGLSALERRTVFEIVCFGLGRIGECTIARYQLALLLCLRDLYNVDVHVYDPVFNKNDIHVLTRLGIKTLQDNSEGKYRVQENKPTLFYLPHCPKQLSNNLLWTNWGLRLSDCIIIANSFNKIVERCLAKTLARTAEYVSKITPYTLELSVINTFKYFEVFNDTSIHVFPNLSLVSPDFWDFRPQPKYLDEDIEFVRASC